MIPVVATYEDLLATSGRQVGDWNVRVGMADPGIGPWAVIYCATDFTGQDPARLPKKRYGTLWPLSLAVSWGDDNRREVVADLQEIDGLRLGKRCLFACTVPLADVGRCRIRLNGPTDDSPRWMAVLDVTQPRPPVWQDFEIAIPPAPRDGGRFDSRAVYPRLDGSAPVANDQDVWSGPLPGVVSGTPLKLSLQGQELVIDAGERLMLDWPDFCLMARWWVNGRPVAGKRRGAIVWQMGRQMIFNSQMRFTMGLPKDLGALKAGDVIGLQVMYCPGGIDGLPDKPGEEISVMMQMIEVEPKQLNQLTLSNRIEFRATAEMLGQ